MSSKRERNARLVDYLLHGPVPVKDVCSVIYAYANGLDGVCILDIDTQRDLVFAVTVLPDGKIISSSRDATVQVWE